MLRHEDRGLQGRLDAAVDRLGDGLPVYRIKKRLSHPLIRQIGLPSVKWSAQHPAGLVHLDRQKIEFQKTLVFGIRQASACIKLLGFQSGDQSLGIGKGPVDQSVQEGLSPIVVLEGS